MRYEFFNSLTSGFPQDILNIKTLKVFSNSNTFDFFSVNTSGGGTLAETILDFSTPSSLYTIITGFEIGFTDGIQLYQSASPYTLNSNFDIRINGSSILADDIMRVGNSVKQEPYIKMDNLLLNVPIFNSQITAHWFQTSSSGLDKSLCVYAKISGYYYSI